ncbi:carbamoyltransferase N-terminal domain-containing protein [Pseudomonas fluorescens]|uniref:carbamoyltransferase N-terminal domain-containing protein n=1 Tax=Pseudomonas TaxID=286 RepID=UPI003D03466B
MAIHVSGISAFHHDSAAALVKDGAPVVAAQEERFTRARHDAVFPGVPAPSLPPATAFYPSPFETAVVCASTVSANGTRPPSGRGGRRPLFPARPKSPRGANVSVQL